jgi:hypothetical protein
MSMTIEEKRDAIKAYCYTHSCGSERDCRLYEFVKDRYFDCYTGVTDEQIEANYEYLFGGEVSSSVDHPSHYAGEKYECIEVMREVFGDEAVRHFCLLNAFKYLWRCGKKHESPDEDIKKDIWYLNKYLATKEENA